VAAERFPVESGHIMMFARAVATQPDLPRQAYAATTECGGVIAPPTLLAAVAHYEPGVEVPPRPGESWMGSGREAAGTRWPTAEADGLHAEHHYESTRPSDRATC